MFISSTIDSSIVKPQFPLHEISHAYCPVVHLTLCLLHANATAQAIPSAVQSSLVFHAPFDGSADAKVSRGDGKVMTAIRWLGKSLRLA